MKNNTAILRQILSISAVLFIVACFCAAPVTATEYLENEQDIDGENVPYSVINPLPTEILLGEKLTVTGDTNLGGGVAVTVKIWLTAYATVPEDEVDSSALIVVTNTTNADGDWEVTFDTARLKVGEYNVFATVSPFDTVSTRIYVVTPTSIVNPIPASITKGTQLTVSGQTNLGEGIEVAVKMVSTAFTVLPPEETDSVAIIILSTITDKNGNWEVTFDTSGLNIDKYRVFATVGTFESASLIISVIAESVVRPSLTINPVPSEITKGTQFTVSGQTKLGEGVEIMVTMVSTAYGAVPEDKLDAASAVYISQTTKTDKDGNWKVTLDTSSLPFDDYLIRVLITDHSFVVESVNLIAPPQNGVVIIENLPENNVLDLYTVKQNEKKLMVSIKGESGTLPKKDVAWTSSNPNVLSIEDDGRYTPHMVGKATITATTEKGTASVTITVIDTTPKPATVPIKEPTKEGDNTKIENTGQTPIQVSSDKTKAIIVPNDETSAIEKVTINFSGQASDDGSGTTVTGKVQSVIAEYKPASAAPADGVGGTIDYLLSLDLTNMTTALPKINSTINSTVADEIATKYPKLKLAAMITAETNATEINKHLAKTGDGITLIFLVPTAWVESMEKIISFHVQNGVIIDMDEISPDDIEDLKNGYCKITIKRGSFSTHGLAGEEKVPDVKPSEEPQTPEKTTSKPQGQSIWLQESATPTPTETVTPTETQTVPTATPEPTTTETESPLSVFAVLGGLATVAVMRRR